MCLAPFHDTCNAFANSQFVILILIWINPINEKWLTKFGHPNLAVCNLGYSFKTYAHLGTKFKVSLISSYISNVLSLYKISVSSLCEVSLYYFWTFRVIVTSTLMLSTINVQKMACMHRIIVRSRVVLQAEMKLNKKLYILHRRMLSVTMILNWTMKPLSFVSSCLPKNIAYKLGYSHS